MKTAQPQGFRAIPDFPGYEVSPEGEVQCWTYRGAPVITPRRILPYLTNSNRWAVKITRDKKRRTVSLGALILMTFVGKPGTGCNGDVDFLDQNPYNINLSNLRWRKSLQPFRDLTP